MPKNRVMYKAVDICPCNSKKSYSCCCQPLHDGVPALDAEVLMRSRYSAYVLDLPLYIKNTWHISTYPGDIEATPGQQWLGLQVKRYELLDDHHAVVEFVARYKLGGRAYRLHEISRFVRENNSWLYVDGDQEGDIS